jgi:ATP/ADP translocase
MHNPIPKYASTASISTLMTNPFHAIPFEKKVFKEVIFLLKNLQTPQVLKRQSIEKKRKKEKKEEEKEKLQESLQIMGKSIF